MVLGQLHKQQLQLEHYNYQQSTLRERKLTTFITKGVCCFHISRRQHRIRKKALKIAKHKHKALETIDYGFYQKLSLEAVTEEYLWNERLLPMLSYLSMSDKAYVRRALALAYHAHQGQFRKSGEPFISHPVEVTRILTELQMDAESLAAGLLHDTVEDTEQVSFELIEKEFGSKVRKIVEGETRLSKITGAAVSERDAKALDLQQLFVTMTEEVRIVVVKLTDRLHNMRTMDSMPPIKQRKISRETAEIFVPLARLLGLYWIKEELEDLSFLYLYPEQHARISGFLRKLEKPIGPQGMTVKSLLSSAKSVLTNLLLKDPIIGQYCTIDCQIIRKSIYTICKNNPELANSSPGNQAEGSGKRPIYQLQVVLKLNQKGITNCEDPSQLCYVAMGKVHSNWQPMPNSIKDYIATPKMNGYRALHTTVFPTIDRSHPTPTSSLDPDTVFEEPVRNLHPKDTPLVELTIRTEEMQLIADYGIAYELKQNSNFTNLMSALPLKQAISGEWLKQGQGQGKEKQKTQKFVNGMEQSEQGKGLDQFGWVKVNQAMLQRRVNWLNGMKEWQKEFIGSLNSTEFVEGVQNDFLTQKVYVFTPEGDLLHLSAGSTPIDFAYHISSDTGDQMIGARVNGHMVSPEYVLENGDVVTVLRYEKCVTAQMVRMHKQWLESSCAKTSSAKLKIKKFVNQYGSLIEGEEETVGNGLVTVKVTVQCDERSGILAEVAQIIADSGYNINSYGGGSNRGVGVMNYRVEGPQSNLHDMMVKIGKVRGIIAWHLNDSSLLRNDDNNNNNNKSLSV